MTPTQVPFFFHDLGQPEIDAVAGIFKCNVLTSGDTVQAFENRFADFLGARHALGVTSCTGALHLSMLALGIGPGDEVITTPMTFIATATAIIEAGATPILVDIEPETGLLDPAKVEAAITPRTRAIIPVHLYGQMCDMWAFRRLADRYGLFLIEDAAHCIEGSRDGIRPGQLSHTACFSFYATKNLTCGEGGAVVTNDDHLAEQLRLLRLHGMTRTAADRAREGYKHWDMVLLGWKYNMDNIHAAILMPQMDRLESNWEKRHQRASLYRERLQDCPGIACPMIHHGVKHAHHLFPVWVSGKPRDSVITDFQEHGIGVVVNYRAIHLLTYFRQRWGFCPGDFPAAERIGDTTLSLPLYPNMPLEHLDKTVSVLRQSLIASRAA